MKFFFASLLVILSAITHAQKKMSSDDTLLTGTWKGTSICQVRPSPCNDEIAVYHIAKGDKPGVYHMVMNKMVNDKEEDMGVNDYIFDAHKKTLTCYDDKYQLTWSFTVTGNRMEGTLVAHNKLYRVIKLTKTSIE